MTQLEWNTHERIQYELPRIAVALEQIAKTLAKLAADKKEDAE